MAFRERPPGRFKSGAKKLEGFRSVATMLKSAPKPIGSGQAVRAAVALHGCPRCRPRRIEDNASDERPRPVFAGSYGIQGPERSLRRAAYDGV